jgi:hypothetical protein
MKIVDHSDDLEVSFEVEDDDGRLGKIFRPDEKVRPLNINLKKQKF